MSLPECVNSDIPDLSKPCYNPIGIDAGGGVPEAR